MKHFWRIQDNLWQADIFGALELASDCIISCTGLSKIEVFLKAPLHVYFPFEDSNVLPDMSLANEIVMFANNLLGKGKTVVVNCNEGCNRSGLIVGMILQRFGIPDVVSFIKDKHPEALYNQTFVKYLQGK